MAGLRSRTRLLLGSALAAVLLYILGGFLLVPLIGRYLILPRVVDALTGSLSVDAIRFNPLRLQLILRGLHLTDGSGAPALTCGEIRLNASLTKSLWWRAIALDELTILSPHVLVHVDERGVLNLAGLFRPAAEPEPANEDALIIPRIRIARSMIEDAGVDLRHDGLPEPFHHRMEQISLVFDRFDTSPVSENITRLEVHTVGGERLVWEGYVALNPLSSAGKVTLSDINLPLYAPFLRLTAQARLQEGLLDLGFHYAFAPLQSPPSVGIENFHLALRQLSLAPLENPQPFLVIGELQIQDVDADLAARTARMEAFSLTDSLIRARRSTDGQLDLLALLELPGREERPPTTNEPGPKSPAAAPALADAASGKPTPAPPAGGGMTEQQASTEDFAVLQKNLEQLLTQALDLEAWQGSVKSIRIENHRVHWIDQAAFQPVDWQIGPLQVQAGPLHSDQQYAIPYQINLMILEEGKLHLQGVLQPLQQRLESELNLERLPLGLLAAYAPPGPEDVQLRRGELDLRGRLSSDLTRVSQDLSLPWISFSGRLMARDLAAGGETQASPQARVPMVELVGIEAHTLPLSLAVETLRILDPQVSLTITRMTEADSAEAPSGEAATTAEEAGHDPTGESNLFGIPSLVYDAPVRIDLLEIQGGNAVFIDTAASDQPLRVDAFQIRLTELNNQSEQPANLQVSMHLLDSALLNVEGQLRPLTAEPTADLTFTLQTLPLPPTTPYAGPILGYRLTQGTLSVNAQATLSGGSELDISSRLVLDQIALGEAIQSPQRIQAPVRLGLSLLRDSRGQIRTPLPRIYGDLNDPSFALGPVIVRTVVTLLTNVATAPFSLLASLVPGGDGENADADLGQIHFAAGSSELTTAAEQVLDRLVRALQERPQLHLVVVGQAGPADYQALRRDRLLSYLQERSDHPERLQAGSEAYRNALIRIYERMGSPLPTAGEPAATTPASPPGAGNKTETETAARVGGGPGVEAPISSSPRRPIPRTHRVGGPAQRHPAMLQDFHEEAALHGVSSTLFSLEGHEPASDADSSGLLPDAPQASEEIAFEQMQAIVLSRMRMPENTLEALASERSDVVARALLERGLASERLEQRSEQISEEPQTPVGASRVIFELQ